MVAEAKMARRESVVPWINPGYCESASVATIVGADGLPFGAGVRRAKYLDQVCGQHLKMQGGR